MKWSARKIAMAIVAAGVVLVVLVITLFAVWRISLAFDVKHQIAAIRAAGLPTDGAEANQYYPAVPDDENAAIQMGKAFKMMANYPDRRSNEVDSLKFPGRTDVLTTEQLSLITGYCAMNSNALTQAEASIRLPSSRYPIDLSYGAETLLPHLACVRRLARVAGFHAVLSPDDSVMAVSTILGMARTLDKEPVLVSKLVRFSIVEMTVSILERRLNSSGKINAPELNRFNELFADGDETDQLANGLIGERAINMPYFQMSAEEINKLENGYESLNGQGGPPLPGSPPIILTFTGFFLSDLRFYLQSMETNIALAKAYPKNISAITNSTAQILQTSMRYRHILSSMLLLGIDSAIFREASEVAHVRTAQAAIAVERFRLVHGSLPENLDELVPQFLDAVPQDPFDGQPLRYHRLQKGYVVYSVGRDGHDNNGRERPVNAKSSDKSEYDITFIVDH